MNNIQGINTSDCKDFVFTDSLQNTVGILNERTRDTVHTGYFEKFITTFDPNQYDYIRDTFRNKSVYLYSGQKGDYDSTSRPDIYADNMYFTIYHDLGFENVNHVIVIWDRCDIHKLKFNTILDLSLNVGIGSLFLREIHQIGKNEYLIIGDSYGGDAGDTWGSLWFAKFKKPRHLELLYEESYSSGYYADEIDRRKYIDYRLDINKLEVDITLKELLESNTINKINTIYTKHIDLKK